MKINNLKINGFGKIKNKEMNLKDGINIVYGKNEAGKSTILKFIVGMLYGSSRNKRGKEISDFDRFTPWNGDYFSGKIKYTLDNNENFEVYREFKKKNPKIYNSNLEDISSMFKNDKTKGIQFFEEQTLIDEETFLNTAIIEQEESRLSKASQSSIIQKIGNQISTGDDNISFKKTIEKINKQQIEKVGTNKTLQKPINIIEEKIAKLENKKEELQEFKEEISNIQKNNEQLKYSIKDENVKIEILKKYKKKLDDNRIRNAEINFNKNLENEYNDNIEGLEKKLKENKDINPNKVNKINITLILETILFFIFLVTTILTKKIIILSICIVNFILIIATQIIKKIYKKNNIKEIKNYEEISKQLNILKNAKENKLKELENENLKLENEFNKEKEKIMQEYISKLDINFLESALLMDYNELLVSIENKENAINSLKLKESINENKLKEIEKQQEEIVKIDEELQKLYSEKKELDKLNHSFNIAKECLNNAYIKMKNSISPKFQEELSNIIYKISDGKYEKIKFDDNTGLTVEIENGNYMVADRLSIGTIDQMYLSLRLSALKEISKENMPIIFDESFAYYDDKRLENILKYLEQEFKSQIIIFTCSKREINILNELNIQYNLINLEN
ncbi:MAG: ATP-binding protein [Candidatus Scatovivens sp.]